MLSKKPRQVSKNNHLFSEFFQISSWMEKVVVVGGNVLDSEIIEEQLKRILESAGFSGSKRLKKFLCHVVSETLAGRAAELRGYNIAVSAYGKDADFDPQDPYIRNIARDVRRAINSYYQTTGLYDPLRISIPLGTYVPEFESVPAKTRGTVSVSDDSATAPFGTDAVALSLEPSAQLPVVACRQDIAAKQSLITDLRPTIAIIPLRFMGYTDDHDIIGEIVADNLIVGLSRSNELQVISRLSTTCFRNYSAGFEEIRDRLGVSYIFSGAYRVLDQHIRLNVELAECESRQVVWADSITTSITALLNSEDQMTDQLIAMISKSVLARELQRALVEPLSTLKCYTLLLGAIQLMHRTSPNEFERAGQMFELLIQRNSRHTLPHAFFAQWHIIRVNRNGGWGVDNSKAISQALLCSNLALEADSRNPLALTISGLVHTNFMKEMDTGLELYETALQINPNEPLTWALKGALHALKGEGEQALQDTEQALRLTPLDPQLYYYESMAAAAAYSAGRYQRAEQLAKRSLFINPNHTSNLRTLIATQMQLDKIREARRYARKLMQLDPNFTTESYLQRSPNADFTVGKTIAKLLEKAGIPKR